MKYLIVLIALCAIVISKNDSLEIGAQDVPEAVLPALIDR